MPPSSPTLFLLLLLLPLLTAQLPPEQLQQTHQPNSCAVITAIFGPSEKEGKPIYPQSLSCSFFLFTNDPSLPSHPTWNIITTPYHLQASVTLGEEKEEKEGEEGWWREKIFSENLIGGESSSFLIAKYYKTQFHKIEILQKYETIIWVDGTIEFTSPYSTKVFVDLAKDYGMAVFEHSRKSLWEEVVASNYGKYAGQRIVDQYARYLRRGYCERWWKNENNHVSPCPYSVDVGDVSSLSLISSPLSPPLLRVAQRQKAPSPDKRPIRDYNHSLTTSPNFGVWVTCYIGFDMRRPDIINFLDLWWDETVYGSTQDQVSFSYLVWHTALVPYTLPGDKYSGTADLSELHIKHAHNIGILQKVLDVWEEDNDYVLFFGVLIMVAVGWWQWGGGIWENRGD